MKRVMDFPTRDAFAKDPVILSKWTLSANVGVMVLKRIQDLSTGLKFCPPFLPGFHLLKRELQPGDTAPLSPGGLPPGSVDRAVLEPSIVYAPYAFAPSVCESTTRTSLNPLACSFFWLCISHSIGCFEESRHCPSLADS